MFTVLFQLFLLLLVVLSFILVIGVPFAYASPQIWNQGKPLIFIGSGLWVVLVILVGVLNFLVV